MASPGPDIDVDVDSDGETDTSSIPTFPAFSGGTASSLTSYSGRSSSPIPSVLSMSSSLRAQAFILEYGRGVNNNSEVYRLPADDQEIERLQKQHLMLREIIGKYPPVLETILADDTPGETKACLDLGCGSGGWIMEVAVDFPNCTCVAVDLVPLQSIAMPPNCRSEVDDINLGLEHFYGDFNAVHARLISAGIKDYPGLVDHISRVLRPGGFMFLGEFDFHPFDGNKQPWVFDISTMGPPWLPRWMEFFKMAVRARGGNTDVSSNMLQWVSEHDAFENVVRQEYWLPASPWMQGDDPETVWQRWIGECARDDLLAMLKSGRPMLLGNGMPEELLKELEGNAIRELKEAKVPHTARIVVVTATKKHPAPP